ETVGRREGKARRVAAAGTGRSLQTRGTGCADRPRGGAQLGSSTASTTWITPFDWNTFWIVTLEALPLASQIVSVLPLLSTQILPPSTVLSSALPPCFFATSIRSLAEWRPGTTW